HRTARASQRPVHNRYHMPVAPGLQDLSVQYDRIEQDAEKLAALLTDAQRNWRTAPGRWSVAQCLAHLNTLGYWYLPYIDAAIRDARARGLAGDGHVQPGRVWGFFIRTTEPPVKMRLKAPRSIQPPADVDGAKALAGFVQLQEEFRKRLRDCEGLDVGRARVRSPLLAWLRMSLGECFTLMASHQRRHLWQAWQVRNDPSFPR
ncbi:MAG: DinB family protein, partial [Bryobacteraceae bacterium]